MKLTDDLLNKYLDGELSPEELKGLISLLENDPDALTTLKTHKFVDSTLAELNTEKAPEGFTKRVMNFISVSSSLRIQKNYFFRTIIALFGVLILAVFVAAYFFTAGSNPEPGAASQVIDSLSSFFVDNFSSLNKFTSSRLLIFIGGFLTFILVVVGYFVLENHKTFKHKLENSYH